MATPTAHHPSERFVLLDDIRVLSLAQNVDVAGKPEQQPKLIEQAIRAVKGAILAARVRGLDERKIEVDSGRLNAISKRELVGAGNTRAPMEKPPIEIVRLLESCQGFGVDRGYPQIRQCAPRSLKLPAGRTAFFFARDHGRDPAAGLDSRLFSRADAHVQRHGSDETDHWPAC